MPGRAPANNNPERNTQGHAMTTELTGGCGWIDGAFMPVDDLRIPVTDNAVTRAETTYTVVGVRNGRFFRLAEHLDRFFDGAQRMRIPVPLSRDKITAILAACVQKSELSDAFVMLALSRGMSIDGSRNPLDSVARVWAYAVPYVWVFTPEEQESGVDALVPVSVRRAPADSVDASIKNFVWQDLNRAVLAAVDAGVRTAILLDHDGYLAEGPGFNVVLIRDGRLRSPGRNCLPGITRLSVFAIAERLGMEASLADLTVTDLYEADEVLAVTTASGITPIVRVDGRSVGDGTPGPISRRVMTEYWNELDSPGPHTTAVSDLVLAFPMDSLSHEGAH